MCTRVLWTNTGKNIGSDNSELYPICGRNMDWGDNMAEKLWVFPRGLKRSSSSKVNGQPVEWVSQYGSISVSAYDQSVSDGMNEKGLAVHALWLSESDYGLRDENKPGLDTDQVLQYYLDNFATVQEVVEDLRNKDIQLVPIDVGEGFKRREVTCHLVMEDVRGESVILEYLNGKKYIYYSGDQADYQGEYNVLTNSPPFYEQLENLKKYKGFGGDQPLPGSTDAADRFVRSAFYLKSLPEPANQREAIAGVLSVMRSVTQPFRIPDEGKPYASATRWRVVIDLPQRLYMYESTLYPTLIQAGNIDFSEGTPIQIFDLTKNRQAIGDISGQLEPAEEDLLKEKPITNH